MHNTLDKYLQAVAHELRGLEPEQRESELREMRGHLEAIVAQMMDGGVSEEEAVGAAIMQFGEARRVGRELQRGGGRQEPRWRVAAAVAGAAILYLFLNVWSLAFIARLGSQGANWIWEWRVHQIVFLSIPFISGLVAGCMAPQSGGRATLWLFGGVAGLIYTAMRFDSWLPYATLGATLLLVWLGAFVGSRGTRRQIRSA